MLVMHSQDLREQAQILTGDAQALVATAQALRDNAIERRRATSTDGEV
jgi:hypothetical protein